MKKKQKIDYNALNSSLMRIPQMKIEIARALLNLGIKEKYELNGRCPKALFEKAKEKNPKISEDYLPYFRLAVYCAENEKPEKAYLSVEAWKLY